MISRIPQPVKIKIRTISAGQSGDLSVVESSRDLPFPVRRLYYIYGVSLGVQRGFHAHKTLQQFLVAVHGRVQLCLEGPAGKFIFDLERPDEGVLIPPGYWREMRDLGPESVVMVLASQDYDEGDYIRDYGEYQRWRQGRELVDRTPYLDLSRYDFLGKDLEIAAGEVFRSGRLINGPRVAEFEARFAELCGVRRAVGVGNGLDALTLILQALDIGPGDEVIVCAAGFVATALAVNLAGARPVFVDCLPSGNLDPAALEAARTEQTRAVIPTHLYGLAADMEAINGWAGPLGLSVIEDACQAHGASLKGRPLGAWGRAAAFSFYPTKNLGALGDGGCVVTDDEELAERVRLMANYGSRQKYDHEIRGRNSRLDELQAAFLLVKLPHLERWNETRRHLAATYEQALDLPGLERPRVPERGRPNWHVYAVRVKDGRRDELAAFLTEHNIGHNVHYPRTIPRQGGYAAEYGALSFPRAEAWAAETLSLPLDATHSQAEIDLVCRRVREFFGWPAI